MGAWLHRLQGDDWLARWTQDYLGAKDWVAKAGVSFEEPGLLSWLATTQTRLDHAVAARRSEFAGARRGPLSEVFHKPSLSRAEAVLIAAAPRSLLLSDAEMQVERQFEGLAARGWWIEEQLARRLLRKVEWRSIAPSWILLRQHWAERARSALAIGHPDLRRLLDLPMPQPLDAIAVLANRLEFRNSLGMRFVPVPGLSIMACVWQTRVIDFEVAQAELKLPHRRTQFAQGSDHPVVWVNHEDAVAFCDWLTARERASGQVGPEDRYRLPRDLEWSRMAGLEREVGRSARERNGRVPGIYPWGVDWPPPLEAGNTAVWQGRDPATATCSVGQFPPNAIGLHDLGTNVMEWCGDRYDVDTDLVVVRGGSWCHSAPENFLLSARRRFVETQTSENLGFRCVLEFHPLPEAGGNSTLPQGGAAHPVPSAAGTAPSQPQAQGKRS